MRLLLVSPLLPRAPVEPVQATTAEVQRGVDEFLL